MKKKRIIIIAILLVFALGGFLVYKKIQGKAVVAREVEPENLVVKKTVSSSGTVTSQNEADIGLAATGILTNFNVEKGEEVTKGEILGNVSNYDSSKTSESYAIAKDIAKRDLEIYKENYETNWDAVGGEDEYRLNVKRLEELVTKADATYQASLGSLSNTWLKAPFDGTLLDIYTDEGEVVLAGSPIAKIADLNNLIFEINLDQEDFGIVKEGQEVLITLDPYPDEEFKGTVSELPFYANESSEEFTVKISIDQNGSDKRVLLGMKGDVEIVIDKTPTEVTTLSFDAIFEDDEGFFIWIDDNGVLDKLYVNTGLEGDIYTQIETDISGLKIVVPEGDTEPEIGMKVQYE